MTGMTPRLLIIRWSDEDDSSIEAIKLADISVGDTVSVQSAKAVVVLLEKPWSLPSKLTIMLLDTTRTIMHKWSPMSSITSLSVQQLRHAAALKEKIQSLEKELGRLLGSTVVSTASPAPKKKFKMSAAAKAKISAAAKLRWAKVRAAKGSAKPAAKKGKGKMSAAAKAKLSAKMKALWAARKAAKK
jgi:hypothetical protein